MLTTALRTNLSTRICHRVDTTEDYLHLFPDGRDLDITAADRTLPQASPSPPPPARPHRYACGPCTCPPKPAGASTTPSPPQATKSGPFPARRTSPRPRKPFSGSGSHGFSPS
ncbi:hypothetical protein GCM10020256_74440 [Streptomyces thermocoprophilus]